MVALATFAAPHSFTGSSTTSPLGKTLVDVVSSRCTVLQGIPKEETRGYSSNHDSDDAAAAGGGTEMDEGIAGRHLWGLEGTGVSSWKEAGPTRGGNALCEAEGGCRARPCSARARSAELAPRSWESQNPSTHSW